MNIKAMAAVVGLGFGGTVLALAASRESAEEKPAVAAEKPAPAVEQPAIAPEPAKEDTTPIPPAATPAVVKVAAEVKPIVEEPRAPTIPQQQLDALLAPVALYPDQLLSQILMASTYPLDVVEAARWVARPENQSLSGEALSQALEAEDWDPSVKALAAFPEILKMMDRDLDWLSKVGDAFAAQQADVMDSVQRLRREARDADKLNSDSRRQVVMQDDQIMIEPANADVVYVPFYNPADAYGVWPYPDYPPVYIPPPVEYVYAPGVVYNFVTIRPFWGWTHSDWRHRHIRIVDPPRWQHHNRGRGHDYIRDNIWRHDPGRDRNRGDRWRHRPQPPQPGATPNQPIVIKDQDFPRRRLPDRWDRNPGARGLDSPPPQPMQRAQPMRPQPGGLPDMPPLPATAHLPALAPPISNPNIGVQAPTPAAVHNEQVDTMRAIRRRDQQWQEEQRRQRENDALRQRQFQDRSISAPVLSNVPPTQQQRWRDNSIAAPPVTNVQPIRPAPPRVQAPVVPAPPPVGATHQFGTPPAPAIIPPPSANPPMQTQPPMPAARAMPAVEVPRAPTAIAPVAPIAPMTAQPPPLRHGRSAVGACGGNERC